jgi:molecular chaperone GrpE (heat shock protein)
MTDQSHRTDDQATMQVARQRLDVLDNFDHAFGQITPVSDGEIAIKAECREACNMILTNFKQAGG